MVPNLIFFVLENFLHFGKFEADDFKYNIFFQIYGSEYPKKAFLVPFFVVAVIVVVVLVDFWYLDKLEGADFKYDISFF